MVIAFPSIFANVLRVVLPSVLLLSAAPIQAGTDIAQPEEAPLPDTGDSIADRLQQAATDSLKNSAVWFDSFFDDDRHEAELNKSRAKLTLSIKYHEEDQFDVSPRLRWRIHLPKVSKYTNLLLFLSEDDDEDFGSGSTDTIDEERSRDDFGIAIKQFLRTGRRYNISATAGASTNYVYGGLRWRYYKDIGAWQVRLVDRLRYYTDDGWENRLSLDMERPLSEKWLFRATGSLNWYESEDGLPHDFSLNLFQFLSPRRAIAYEWLNSFETRPDYELADLRLQVRYRQQFFRKWLLYEIKPRVNFTSENDHDPEYSIYVSLEARFGHDEGQKLKNVFRF